MAARELAASVETVVAVTGERDLVTDGSRNLIVSGGHPLLGSITGTGCAASSAVGAFLTADSDALLATAAALAFFGLAAQRAAERAVAPGSFWVALLDALFNLTPEDLASGARIEDA
jgi:hydroxyethylthiazole kinase